MIEDRKPLREYCERIYVFAGLNFMLCVGIIIICFLNSLAIDNRTKKMQCELLQAMSSLEQKIALEQDKDKKIQQLEISLARKCEEIAQVEANYKALYEDMGKGMSR